MYLFTNIFGETIQFTIGHDVFPGSLKIGNNFSYDLKTKLSKRCAIYWKTPWKTWLHSCPFHISLGQSPSKWLSQSRCMFAVHFKRNGCCTHYKHVKIRWKESWLKNGFSVQFLHRTSDSIRYRRVAINSTRLFSVCSWPLPFVQHKKKHHF